MPSQCKDSSIHLHDKRAYKFHTSENQFLRHVVPTIRQNEMKVIIISKLFDLVSIKLSFGMILLEKIVFTRQEIPAIEYKQLELEGYPACLL